MQAKCIENKYGNTNFILGKTYKIRNNLIDCECIHLDLKKTKLTDVFDFAMCKFELIKD